MWWLRVGGYPATRVAPHSAPTFETWADGGCGQASWEFGISVRSQHQAVRLESPVELMCGPYPVFAGLMSEPDRTTGECVAFGMASYAKNYLALDGSGNATSDLATAIATAIGEGWQVTNPTPISGTVAATESNGAPVTLDKLLDDYAAQTGQRWGVDARRRLYMRPDPTAPMWLASPGAAAFGMTNEDRARKLYARYPDVTSGLFETASAGSGSPQVLVSELEDKEPMTRAAAEAYLNGILTRDLSKPAWTNGATLAHGQVRTIGGSRAALGAIRAQQMMRAPGLSSAYAVFALDAVIGKTRYTVGDQSVYVEPVNTAPRTFVDVQAAA